MFPFLVAIKVLASLLGLFIVAIALPFARESSPPPLPETVSRTVADGWRYVALPSWADWIWGNDKYGAEGRGFFGFQIAWQGWRAGLYWILPYGNSDKCLRVRLGYKINPSSSKSESAALSVLINPYANFGK